MKTKFFAVLLCCMTAWSGVSAQKAVSAFSNLSLGVEFFSTTGLGIELATPLSPNFALRGGLSMLPVNYSISFGAPVDQGIISEINNAITSNPGVMSILSQKGLPTRAEDISTDVNATASLNFVNGKILIDYYPSAKHAFHITAGVYIGSSELIKLKGKMNQAVDFLNVLKDNNVLDNNGVDFIDRSYVVDQEKGYQLNGSDIRDISGSVKISTVKPYLGLGFGRAVPKRRVGLTFEIGAFYQGTPALKSDNPDIQKLIDGELTGVTEILNKLPIYPVLSLKLNFRIL